jgi:hypothetical protein
MPTSVKNPQANAILEGVHQVITTMLCTTKLDMANTVVTSDIYAFLTDAAWAIFSPYHIVLRASPDAIIFGQDMLFDIPFIANWNTIGDHRQSKTDLITEREIAHIMIRTTKLVIKYFLEKMISSENQRVGINVILGLSHHFVQ